MAQLNYEVLKASGYDGFVLKDAPEKVMQFGEGNFLRAFVDYFIDIANENAGFMLKQFCFSRSRRGLLKLLISKRDFTRCICAAMKRALRSMRSALYLHASERLTRTQSRAGIKY